MNKLLGNKMHWMGAQCTDSLDDWRSAYGPALLKSEGRPVMQCTRISSLSTESGENRWKWGGERLHTLSSVGEAGSLIAGSSSVMTVSSYFYTFTLMLNSFRNWSILILCDRYSKLQHVTLGYIQPNRGQCRTVFIPHRWQISMEVMIFVVFHYSASVLHNFVNLKIIIMTQLDW